MPSHMHQGLTDLFRDQPELVAELMSGTLGVAVPEYQSLQAAPADLSDKVPTEYRADVVVKLATRRNKPVLAVVIEVQLRRDAQKRWSWPVYVATLRARLMCPVELFVVCPNPRVAAWCGEPIALGACGSQITPMVMSLDVVPVVDDVAHPALAVLSAIAHGAGEHRTTVLPAMMRSLANVPSEQRDEYIAVVHQVLPRTARRYLEKIMKTDTEMRASSFGQWLRREGKAEGKAEVVLMVLDARAIALSDQQRELISQCRDPGQLEEWARRAGIATAAEDVFDGTPA